MSLNSTQLPGIEAVGTAVVSAVGIVEVVVAVDIVTMSAVGIVGVMPAVVGMSVDIVGGMSAVGIVGGIPAADSADMLLEVQRMNCKVQK